MGKPSRKFEKKIDDLLEKLQSGGGWPLLVVADVCGGKWRRGEPVGGWQMSRRWWRQRGVGSTRMVMAGNTFGQSGRGWPLLVVGRCVRRGWWWGCGLSDSCGLSDWREWWLARRGWWWPETPSAMEFAGREGESWMGLWKMVWKLGIVNVTWTNPRGVFVYSHHATSTVGVIKFAHCGQENGADPRRADKAGYSFLVRCVVFTGPD
ncbi:Uncharacterized protein Fot_52789 [Forsythia ovata]|uniref:Uncharacterized protein n=1 Tax=Forsythia ovata TaxID=205694 RepID=A0ABD1PIG6_9LAMI